MRSDTRPLILPFYRIGSVPHRLCMDGLLSPQSKSLLRLIRSKSRPAVPRARRLRIRRQPEPEIVDESGRLRSTKGVALRLIQFLAIMLTALALVPSGAHLAALPNKMAMAHEAYFIRLRSFAARDTGNSSGSPRGAGRCGRSRRAYLSVDCLKASQTSVHAA
jgi:hypothetical protein